MTMGIFVNKYNILILVMLGALLLNRLLLIFGAS